jgi:para-nitrobenzyl esterase
MHVPNYRSLLEKLMRDPSPKPSTASPTASRRDILHGACGALAVTAMLRHERTWAAVNDEFPVVESAYGKLRGRRRPEDGVSSFKGVPFGAPTGGSNRFLPPQRPASWNGVRDALHVGHPCPQINPDTYEWWIDPEVPSEDCLYLNIWSPSIKSGSSLPVMVWLHGGGFVWGSGGAPAYDGQNLARTGNVVVVTVNHRLHLFGYTYLAEHGGDRFASSGNAGQLDIVAALEWVRGNIGHFGGDPSNVTIFGESGGGAKVSTLIAMPAASGLFHKAIVQSGSSLSAADPAEAGEVTDRLYRFLGIKPGDVAALQRIPTDKMIAALADITGGSGGITAPAPGQPARHLSPLSFGPVFDGHAIPKQTWTPQAPEYATRIPMIIGITTAETALSCGIAISGLNNAEDASIAAAASTCSWGADPAKASFTSLLPIYRRMMPNLTDAELVVRMTTDTGTWRSALLQATRKIEAGGPSVFMYEFGWKVPFVGGSWAQHGVDLAFVFGYTDYPKAWEDDDSTAKRAAADPLNLRYRLATQTMQAWAAFARTGNPSTSSLKWPAYDLTTRSTMVFDGQSQVVNDPRSAIREAVLSST